MPNSSQTLFPQRIINILKTHEKYANQHGQNFNIFSILKAERKEVETHSRFIYELLNPNGSHGQGSLFLDLFVEHALEIEATNIQNPKREDITLFNDANRRIDFTISSDNYLIAIEMKIDAGDQYEQLYDYYKELEKRRLKSQEIKMYYLTLSGESPSQSSLKELTEDQYTNISFKDNIIKWLDISIQKSANKHVLREALLQYKNLIEKLTTTNNEAEMKIVDEIILSEDNMTAAINISNALNKAKSRTQLQFWNTLEQQLNKLGYEFIFYHNELYKKNGEKDIKACCQSYFEKNKCWFGYIYDLGPLKAPLDKYHLVMYIEVDWRVYFGFGLAEIKDGKLHRVPECNLEKFNVLKTKLNTIHGLNSESREEIRYWLSRKRFLNIEGNDISFREFNTAAISLTDEQALKNAIEKNIEEIASVLNDVKSKDLTESTQIQQA